jgi:putative transcriptional regulator
MGAQPAGCGKTGDALVKTVDLQSGVSFIAAMPQLDDPNFRRSVVLLLRCDERGSLGLIINRPSRLSLTEFCASQSLESDRPAHELVMVGGPCDPESHLLVLHGEQPLRGADPQAEDELQLGEGIHLVSSLEALAQLVVSARTRVRCYLGYAGWGPGQLEGELAEGSWVVLPANRDLIFVEPSSRVWERALRDAEIDPLALTTSGGDPS